LIGARRRPRARDAGRRADRVFNCGEYRDKLVPAGNRLLFREELRVFDSLLVPNSLIFPL